MNSYKKNTVHAIITLSCTDINVSDVLKVFVTVQSQPPKCYAFYTCFLKFCLALNSYILNNVVFTNVKSSCPKGQELHTPLSYTACAYIC